MKKLNVELGEEISVNAHLIPKQEQNFHTLNSIKTRKDTRVLQIRPSCNCKKILIVDDNEFNIYTLKELLLVAGVAYDVDYA